MPATVRAATSGKNADAVTALRQVKREAGTVRHSVAARRGGLIMGSAVFWWCTACWPDAGASSGSSESSTPRWKRASRRGLRPVRNGYTDSMKYREPDGPESDEDEQGHSTVPGRESHESEDALSPDELGTEDEPVPPPSEPKQA